MAENKGRVLGRVREGFPDEKGIETFQRQVARREPEYPIIVREGSPMRRGLRQKTRLTHPVPHSEFGQRRFPDEKGIETQTCVLPGYQVELVPSEKVPR